MQIAVIPAYNEAKNIAFVLKNLQSCNLQQLIFVANGCTDCTENKILQINSPQNIDLISFPVPLGLDIPRAVGAAYAKQYKPTALLFLDGDMCGPLGSTLQNLLKGIKQGLDLALTNCYPTPATTDLANLVLKYRYKVNKKLGLVPQIGLATPSHGPHAISGKLLTSIPLKTLAIPPLALAWTAENKFRIGLGATISHHQLGSPLRTMTHTQNIAATIIGDCQQALHYLEGTPLKEIWQTPQNHTPYRRQRRFDLLEQFLSHYS